MRPRVLASALAMALLSLPAWPAEVSYDFVACTHTRQTVVEASPELVAFGLDNWGIVANSTTKEWENATTRCVGYLRVAAGKPVGKGVCRWIVSSGDTAVGEFEYPPAGEASFTWLTGTGKFKGIQGGGTFKQISNAKPSESGTSQACRRDWGKYTLP